MKMKKILQPCLIVLSGPPLTGKTILAEKLVKQTNLEVVDVDVIRNEIDESRKENQQIRMLEPEQEKTVMTRSYKEMCQQTEKILDKSIPVIMTGTFSIVEFKEPLERLVKVLRKKNVPLKVFLLTVSDEEALKRIERRKKNGSFSNIDSFKKFRWAKRIFSKIEFVRITEIDTSQANYVEQTLKQLEDLEVSK